MERSAKQARSARDYWLTVVSTFLFFMAISAFVLMPRQLLLLGASAPEIGWIMGSTQVTTAVFMLLVGLGMGQFSPKGLMMRGALLFAATCVGLSFVDRIGWVLYLARALQGVGFALFFVSAGFTVVAVVPEEKRARGISLWGAGVLITQAVAPLVGEQIIEHAGYATFYLAAAGCCAAAMIVARFISVIETDEGPSTPMLKLLRHRNVTMGLVALLGSAIGFGSIIAFLSAFAEREELGPVSPYFAAYTICSLLARILGGHVADRVDRRLVIVPALLLGAGAISGLAWTQNGLHLAIAGGAYGVASGYSYPTLMAYVVDQVSPADRPRVIALDNWSFTVGILIGNLAFGPIADALSMRAAFPVAAIPAIIGVGCVALGTRRARPSA